MQIRQKHPCGAQALLGMLQASQATPVALWRSAKALRGAPVTPSSMRVQVRLMDGARLAARFNPTQTVGDLRRCATRRFLGPVPERPDAPRARYGAAWEDLTCVWHCCLPDDLREEQVTWDGELPNAHADDRQAAHACMQCSSQT